MNKFSVLFDMDGVMLDTESQYDKFWSHSADRYSIPIPNFSKVIKGTTLPNILKKYFSEYSKSDLDNLVADLDEFETNMDFTEIPGSIAFVNELKKSGIKVGLVTSSTNTKLVNVNKVVHFDQLFDTIVSAERVEHGKPNPECFLLGAKDLGVDPKSCFVFEDSFAGIEAGTVAGMKVIGLATTNPAEALASKCIKVIPDFTKIRIADLEELA